MLPSLLLLALVVLLLKRVLQRALNPLLAFTLLLA